MKTVDLTYGALTPPIGEQLTALGFAYRAVDVQNLQADADAATRLNVRGLISSSVAHTIRKKIHKKVVAVVRAALK